ncbi:MAG: hypothetical protein ACHQU0_02555 [Candidatus Paceibacteria bacterium]
MVETPPSIDTMEHALKALHTDQDTKIYAAVALFPGDEGTQPYVYQNFADGSQKIFILDQGVFDTLKKEGSIEGRLQLFCISDSEFELTGKGEEAFLNLPRSRDVEILY